MRRDWVNEKITAMRLFLKATIILLSALSAAASAYALPTFNDVKSSYKKSDAVLLDRHGVVIHELRVDPKGRRLEWVRLKDISPSLIKAVLYSEDRRFYEHGGVDWRAVGSSVIKNLFTDNRRGASTITMQVAARLDKGLQPKGGKRSLSQKWEQIKAAEELEKGWSKDQILEAYLNLITFRGELQGIAAASRGLFDKEPGGLNEAESIILASLIRSPNAPVADVAKRGCILGKAMNSSASCEDIKNMAERKLSGPYTVRPNISLAPHVARQLLLAEKSPHPPGREGIGSVQTTLDGRLQKFATEALQYQLNSLRDQNVKDGAVLVVDNRSGEILAYVGSSAGSYVDGVKAKRQAGSTLKPFLYGLAIERRLLTAASIIDDAPLNVETSSGLYVPQNYDNEYKGPVTVRTALSSSLNIPAVKTLVLTGTELFAGRLRTLGFDLRESGDYYGYSLALGSADVSLYELVNAYRSLANGGLHSGLRLLHDNGDPPPSGNKGGFKKRVMKREATFIVSNILSDREARSLTFGLENPLSTRFWTAVKTGTSKDMRDNWCVGYSEKYTVGVWVGNFSGEPMWNVSGITGAAPAWLEIMDYLHRGKSSKPPRPISGVLSKRVDFQHGMEPAREEWFIKGTEPHVLLTGDLTTGYEPPRISYPSNGTIIALDPDIPDEQQRVFFEAQAYASGLEWVLNDQKIGESGTAVSRRPKAGRHLLALVDKEDRVIDSVRFEVRGSEPYKE